MWFYGILSFDKIKAMRITAEGPAEAELFTPTPIRLGGCEDTGTPK